MIKFKFNMASALENIKYNSYAARTNKAISQETLKKLLNNDTNITLETLNRLCILLDMDIKSIIEYVESPEEIEKWKLKK